jgi:predicted SAM-dependent methyltransferase
MSLVRRLRARLSGIALWLTVLRVREQIARRHLRGHGIEIGALSHPLRMPRGASVDYVDKWSGEELRAQYPDLADEKIVAPDIVDDATRLATIPDSSQDFVVANHFLEHCEDTVGALKTFLRVTRPGGVVFVAVPDKRRTFDAARPTTPLEHVLRDHELGPEVSRVQHYEEFARLVEGVPDDALPGHVVDALENEQYHMHFHVWTHETFLQLLDALRERLGFELVEERSHAHESIVVLRRLSLSPGPEPAPQS